MLAFAPALQTVSARFVLALKAAAGKRTASTYELLYNWPKEMLALAPALQTVSARFHVALKAAAGQHKPRAHIQLPAEDKRCCLELLSLLVPPTSCALTEFAVAAVILSSGWLVRNSPLVI
jgi:hypothetical protein